MNNSLTDLNNHLFSQLERLSDKSLTEDQIKQECERAASIVEVSDAIIGNANLQLKAATLFAQHGSHVLPMLPQIGRAKSEAGA